MREEEEEEEVPGEEDAETEVWRKVMITGDGMENGRRVVMESERESDGKS